MTDAEFDSLATKYKTDDNMFHYGNFCGTINSAFTQKGIDKDPNHLVKKLTSDDTVVARRKYLDISPEENESVIAILEDYRRAVKNRRINLKPQYQDFDITKNGHVTKPQFIRVLAQLGINAPDNVMNVLLKRYMDKGNVDEVNYVDFCNEIDSPTDMFGVGRDYN